MCNHNALSFQVAAELDRSDTARCLIERSSEANVADDSGMTALVLMITKMPNVVGRVSLSITLTHKRAPCEFCALDSEHTRGTHEYM